MNKKKKVSYRLPIGFKLRAKVSFKDTVYKIATGKSGGAYLFLWYKGFPNPHEIREMRR